MKRYTKTLGGLAGIAIAALSWGQAKAQSGYVLSLDGSTQYMTVPHSTAFNADANGVKGIQNMTITFRFKTAAGGTNARVVAKRASTYGVDKATGGTNGTGYEAFLNSGNSGQLGPNLRTTASNPNLGAAFNANTGLYNNAWHHATFIVAYDGTNTINSTYVDGSGYTTKSTVGAFDMSNLVTLVIGADCSFNNKYAGLLDDIRIYNKAFTAGDVATDMATVTVDGTTPNLVAAWDFENVSGSTVPDVSGNNHDGTLVGNPVLPLSLLSFQAKASGIGHQINLNWKTANERSFSHFDIESSQDGQHFTKVGSVSAKGNASGTENTYHYSFSANGAAVAYVRLKSVDQDGSSSYSSVIAVSFNKSASLSLSPNPVVNQLHLDSESAGTLGIYTTAGKLVKQFSVAKGANSFNVATLGAGVYLAKLSTASGTQSTKLVKK